MSAYNSRAVIPSTLQVVAAHNAAVLNEETDHEIIAALELCGSKVLHRDSKGCHKETQLAPGLYPSGIRGTRCFINLERVKPNLRAKLAPPALKLDVVDRVNLYISPPGTGAPVHFDICTVVIIQLLGLKLWQVASKPAVATPAFNTVADEESGVAWHGKELLNLPEHMHFALLKPGDWLLIPRGTWHATFSERGSVAATLALRESGSLYDWFDRLAQNAEVPPQGRRLRC